MNKWVFVPAIVIFLLIVVGNVLYVYSKCGMKGFLFGNGATYAAYSGACDK